MAMLWRSNLRWLLVGLLVVLADCSGRDYGFLFADAGRCFDAGVADGGCAP